MKGAEREETHNKELFVKEGIYFRQFNGQIL